MNKLQAGTGIVWLKQGFNLFRQQPGMLTMLLFSNLLFAVLLSALPRPLAQWGPSSLGRPWAWRPQGPFWRQYSLGRATWRPPSSHPRRVRPSGSLWRRLVL